MITMQIYQFCGRRVSIVPSANSSTLSGNCRHESLIIQEGEHGDLLVRCANYGIKCHLEYRASMASELTQLTAPV